MGQRKQLAAFDGPRVMVLHEHHAKWYMDASTEEAMHRSALRVLKGRMSMNDVFYNLDSDKEFRLEAERIIARKDGKAAWEHLRERFDAEDERISLEKISATYLSNESEDS